MWSGKTNKQKKRNTLSFQYVNWVYKKHLEAHPPFIIIFLIPTLCCAFSVCYSNMSIFPPFLSPTKKSQQHIIMFLQHNWTHLIREKQRRKCHLIRRDMMYIQPYVFKGILSVLIKTLPNLWTYRAACQPYGKSLPSILRLWINNKHYLVNLNEKNTSMLNLIEVETYKKNKTPLGVNFFFQYSSL